MSYQRLTESLAQRWLMGVPVFGKMLKDTGLEYNGHPVFEVEYRWLDDNVMVRVYRYTPSTASPQDLLSYHELRLVPRGRQLPLTLAAVHIQG